MYGKKVERSKGIADLFREAGKIEIL